MLFASGFVRIGEYVFHGVVGGHLAAVVGFLSLQYYRQAVVLRGQGHVRIAMIRILGRMRVWLSMHEVPAVES